MKRYLWISKDGLEEMNEEEMINRSIKTFIEYAHSSIESEYKKRKINTIYSERRKYYKKKPFRVSPCLTKKCNSKSIYSHSISKKAVLNNIAKSNFVYTPSIIKGKVAMKKIGISEASIFPGFCIKHDVDLFDKVDNPLNVNFDEEFFSQVLLRATSRESFVIQREISNKESLISKLKNEYEKCSQDFFEKFYKSKRFKYNGFSCSYSEIHESIKQLSEDIEKIKFYEKVFNQDFFSRITIVNAFIIEKSLPIAFSGLCMLRLEEHNILLLVSCLPYINHTVISIYYAEHNTVEVERYLSKYDFNDESSLLKMLEIITVRGSDNVFFNIDYWDNLDSNIKKRITSDFINVHDSFINSEIDYSFLEWNWNKNAL